MRLGLMFEHGNSVGAAFVLFELGIGINVGVVAWLMGLFGARRVLLWVGFITAFTLLLAYAAERPLYFAQEEASHTHAFDEWSSPFPFGAGADAAIVRDKPLQNVDILEPVALGGLALLLLTGTLLRTRDRLGRLDAFLLRRTTAPDRARRVWDRDIPGPVLGLVALLGLVAFSVVALYLYYPAPKEAFAEITKVRVEAMYAVQAGHKDDAIRHLQQWDLLTRKVQVGVFIRTGQMAPGATKATEDLRERLEDVRDAVLANRLSEARELLPRIEEAHRECRRAYQVGAPANQ
jgi:uncharacterized protein